MSVNPAISQSAYVLSSLAGAWEHSSIQEACEPWTRETLWVPSNLWDFALEEDGSAQEWSSPLTPQAAGEVTGLTYATVPSGRERGGCGHEGSVPPVPDGTSPGPKNHPEEPCGESQQGPAKGGEKQPLASRQRDSWRRVGENIGPSLRCKKGAGRPRHPSLCPGAPSLHPCTQLLGTQTWGETPPSLPDWAPAAWDPMPVSTSSLGEGNQPRQGLRAQGQ